MPEKCLQEAQCFIRPGLSATDMIFVIRQVHEKCIEYNLALYSIFIYLTKAFDTINREALWIIRDHYGCPKKVVNILWVFHYGMLYQPAPNTNPREPTITIDGIA